MPDRGKRDGGDTPPTRHYVTPAGLLALQNELRHLLRVERPKVAEIVGWAAAQGDRSENGDYLYNKKRLREIDRRVRYLTSRIETAEVVDPRRQQGLEQVFFGATVTYARADGSEITLMLVGIDEAELARGRINWTSPVGQALLKKRVGEQVTFRGPGGTETVEILEISYVIRPGDA